MVYLGHFSLPPPPIYKREASFNCVSCGAPVIHQDCDYCGRMYDKVVVIKKGATDLSVSFASLPPMPKVPNCRIIKG